MTESTSLVNDQIQNNPLGLWSNLLSLLMINNSPCLLSKQHFSYLRLWPKLSLFMIKSTSLVNDQFQNNPLCLWSNQLSLFMIKTILYVYDQNNSLFMIKTILYVDDQNNSLFMIKTMLCLWSKQLSVHGPFSVYGQNNSLCLWSNNLIISDQIQNNSCLTF